MKTLTTLIALSFCGLLLQAQRIYVPVDQPSIQAGIDAAADGDTVLVADSTYYENINFKGKAITLASHFLMDGDTSHIHKTVINGSSPSNPDTASVIFIPKGADQTTVICGFTITGGKGTLDLFPDGVTWLKRGGGIFIEGTSCIVKYNLITGNVINYDLIRISAAGIYADAGTGKEIQILNNVISNNKLQSSQATCGAGIVIDNGLRYNCKFVIDSNTISGNIAKCTTQKTCAAGGIECLFGLPTAGECVISHNLIEDNQLIGYATSTYAGGIRILYTEPGTYFEDNNPLPVITNNIIRNNTAIPGGGGAIALWTDWHGHNANSKVTPQPVIINNTVAGNTSNGSTGIFNWRSFPLVMNNIFWNTNLDPEFIKELENIAIPALGTNNGIIYAFNNDIKNGFFPDANDKYADNIDDEPGFVPDTFLLDEGSPCIGTGLGSKQFGNYVYWAPDNDYFFNLRPDPVDNLVDIGAHESPYPFIDSLPPILTLVSPDSLYQPASIEAKSSEIGMIYLVPENTEKQIESITGSSLYSVKVEAEDIDKQVSLPLDTLDNGVYWLYATDTSDNISDPEIFSIYGVYVDEWHTANFRMFPNPTKGILIIEKAIPGQASIEIHSVTGQLILRKDMKSNSKKIDLSDFSRGIYFVTVRSVEFIRTERIIKL
jgi:hypothetical protein